MHHLQGFDRFFRSLQYIHRLATRTCTINKKTYMQTTLVLQQICVRLGINRTEETQMMNALESMLHMAHQIRQFVPQEISVTLHSLCLVIRDERRSISCTLCSFIFHLISFWRNKLYSDAITRTVSQLNRSINMLIVTSYAK